MHIFLNYIKEHYTEAITLGDLAQSARVSKSECLRCFKLSMQDTPYHYLLEYRLQAAAGLHLNGSGRLEQLRRILRLHRQGAALGYRQHHLCGDLDNLLPFSAASRHPRATSRTSTKS